MRRLAASSLVRSSGTFSASRSRGNRSSRDTRPLPGGQRRAQRSAAARTHSSVGAQRGRTLRPRARRTQCHRPACATRAGCAPSQPLVLPHVRPIIASHTVRTDKEGAHVRDLYSFRSLQSSALVAIYLTRFLTAGPVDGTNPIDRGRGHACDLRSPTRADSVLGAPLWPLSSPAALGEASIGSRSSLSPSPRGGMR